MCVCVVFIYLYGPFREMNHIEQAFSSFLPISKQTPNSLTSKNLLTFLSFKRTKIFIQSKLDQINWSSLSSLSSLPSQGWAKG